MIPVIIFLGPPGAGKSTHGKRLSQELGWYYLRVGDLVKAYCAAGQHHEEDCEELDRKYLAGIPQPDEVVLGLVEPALAGLSGITGLIIDAFPLSIGQAEALEAMRERFGLARPTVLFLHAGEQIVTSRISERVVCSTCGASYSQHDEAYKASICGQCGAPLMHRRDDTPEVVHRRYDEYRVRLAPVEEYYRQQGVLIEFNGERHLDEVHSEIVAVLRERKIVT